MDQLVSDIRSGLRMLGKYPTLSIVSILTLGLGIGLSTTVFSVVNGGLFKGLPFPDAERVVAVVTTNPGAESAPRPHRHPRFCRVAGASDQLRASRRLRFRADEPLERGGPPGTLQRRAAEHGGVRGPGRAAAARTRVPRRRRSAGCGACRPARLWRSGAIATAATPALSARRFAPTASAAPSSGSCRRPSASRFGKRCGPRSSSIRWRRDGARPRRPGDRPAQARGRPVGRRAPRPATIAAQLEREFPATNRGRRRRRDALCHDHPRTGDLRAALHDARRRDWRAAHRLRQRLEPARGPGVAAAARGRRPDGAWRQPRSGSCAST